MLSPWGHLSVGRCIQRSGNLIIHPTTLGLRNPSGPQYACNLFLLNASSPSRFPITRGSPRRSALDFPLSTRLQRVSTSELHLTEPLCRLNLSLSSSLVRLRVYCIYQSAAALPAAFQLTVQSSLARVSSTASTTLRPPKFETAWDTSPPPRPYWLPPRFCCSLLRSSHYT